MKPQTLSIISYCPLENVSEIRDALNELGVLTVGDYDQVFTYQISQGSWRPLEGSNPYEGKLGEISEAEEARIEFRCPEHLATSAVAKIREIHPYEEPVINVIPLLNEMYGA